MIKTTTDAKIINDTTMITMPRKMLNEILPFAVRYYERSNIAMKSDGSNDLES
jgi:hypothetical protein